MMVLQGVLRIWVVFSFVHSILLEIRYSANWLVQSAVQWG
jgi:hypothetical protein